jgi:DNA-binding LacI/PurR family transcriptional regulator
VTGVEDDSGQWHTLECLDPLILGGLILISSGVTQSDTTAREAFLRRVAGIPTCGVAMEPPDASSVSIDNASGLFEVVRHLVHHHDYRRFAYVGGPEEDDDARARLSAFRQALHAEGLELDESRILPGRRASRGEKAL